MLTHIQREYSVNVMFLSCLGLWPLQRELVRKLLPIFYIMFEISYSWINIVMLYDYWEDMRIVLECCYQLVLLTTFVTKLFNEFWNRDKIRCLYETMDDHWNIFTSESELRILKDCAVISRKFTMIYSISIYIMLTIFFMIPLTPIILDIVWPLDESRSRSFGTSIHTRLDQDKYYVPLFCYNMSLIVLGAVVMVSVDTMYVACVVHACGLFSIISKHLEEMTSKLGTNKDISKHRFLEFELPNERAIYQEYIICLKKYQLALKFVDALNSTYKMIALILLLLNGATISLVGIRIVYVLDQLKEVMRFSFIIIGMLIQLMIICYSGQKLMDESQAVFYRAYVAKWYMFSPRLKSLLIITLYKSTVPRGLTAGNIFPLSMMTYAAVIRTAISYFMTFLSLKN